VSSSLYVANVVAAPAVARAQAGPSEPVHVPLGTPPPSLKPASTPPEPEPEPEPEPKPEPKPKPKPKPKPVPDAKPLPSAVGEHGEVIVIHEEALVRTKNRSASDFHVDRKVLESAPRSEGAEVLRTAPGLYIGKVAGAVAHRYMLRGFDADHGQDLELKVGLLPINLPSHIHGQGYADLSFLIGEVVQSLDVSEGVYDPSQGDFAVAGSINVDLGVSRRGIHIKSGYGRFGSQRHLLVWAPPHHDAHTFGAVQYTSTDGFGDNRRGQSISSIVQTEFKTSQWYHRLIGVLYGARSDLPGVLRHDDVDAGLVDYYGVYDYATARAQNAL